MAEHTLCHIPKHMSRHMARHMTGLTGALIYLHSWAALGVFNPRYTVGRVTPNSRAKAAFDTLLMRAV